MRARRTWSASAFGFHRSTKREGDDTEAINKLFTPEFRNRLDAVVTVRAAADGGRSAKVVDKFILQLEAQLADRNVSIELSRTRRGHGWSTNGYDEAMGARPMARVIQQTIKTPLADEVLFGRLKNGGAVRVVVVADEHGKKKLGFVYPEGPALPRPDREIVESAKKRVRAEPEVRRARGAKEAETPDDELADGDEPAESEPEAPLKN